MNKQQIIEMGASFVENSEYNYISEETAISSNCVNMKIYEAPIFGFASSTDEYFSVLKKPEAIGEHFLLPNDWLQEGETIISFFLPYSEKIKKGNQRDLTWPSEEWLHGRIEGQILVNKLCNYLNSQLTNAGYKSIVPSLDSRFCSESGKRKDGADSGIYTSNWSERHVAFVCGLGTFGLSKGFITRKGIAGRIGSIITQLPIPPDTRNYESIYEYCNNCGKCVKNCPAHAISKENGKNHNLCSDFIYTTKEKFKPRYGCGKCQVSVPCENSIPKKSDKSI